MSLIYIFLGIIILFIIWSIPTLLLSFAIRKITRKKFSKVGCIFICAVIFYICLMIEVALIGIHEPGFLDLAIRFACLSIVFSVLYDKNIPSVFQIKYQKSISSQKEKHEK